MNALNLSNCSNEHILNVLKNTSVRPFVSKHEHLAEYERIQKIARTAEHRRFMLASLCEDGEISKGEMDFYRTAFTKELDRICANAPYNPNYKAPHDTFLHTYA